MEIRQYLIILGIISILLLGTLVVWIDFLPGPYGMISIYQVNESDTKDAIIIPLTDNDLRIFSELDEILRGKSETVTLSQEEYSKYRDICDFYYSSKDNTHTYVEYTGRFYSVDCPHV